MNLQNLQAEIAEAIIMNDCHCEWLTPAANITIYQHNMQSALTKALEHCYPLLVKLIGKDFFLLTAKEYLACYPSLSSDLNDYGAYVSDFIANYAPLADYIYLPEVAKFEWTCHRLARLAEHLSFDVCKLEGLDKEQYPHLYFSLNPASDVLSFTYPILRIIALCKNEIPGPIDMQAGETRLLIYRRQQHVSLVSLTMGEYHFLKALQANKALTTALDIALDKDPLFKLDEKLPVWINNKVIVDCSYRKQVMK